MKSYGRWFATLSLNNTKILVPREASINVVGSRQVFKPKLNADGILEHLKARFVAKRYNQIDGIDFSETYSHVIKPSTIRLIFSIVVVKGWII